MTIKLAAVVTILAALHAWLPALVLAVPLAFVVGRRSAVRTNGRQMIATGTHRLVRGTW